MPGQSSLPRADCLNSSAGAGRPRPSLSLVTARLPDLEYDPEKHALGLDPRVGTGFPSRQTRSVCAEIMLKQKDSAG
jgi:hypothetical protein